LQVCVDVVHLVLKVGRCAGRNASDGVMNGT
jgi:hypothetical protein